jgi:hypothetical protein
MLFSVTSLIANICFHHLASIFNCQAESFSFTYLGLSLASSKPSGQECLPLANRVERRLVSTSI